MNAVSAPVARPAWLVAAGYVVMLAACLALFFVIRSVGAGLTAAEAPAAASLTKSSVGQVDVMLHVLATLAAVVALGNVLGRACVYLGQPPVIGEVVAGIVLGPSLLGAVAPQAMHWLIPDANADPQGQVVAALKAIALLGVILYMFLVGLDLDIGRLRSQLHAAVAISHASIVLPFILGAGLALWLYPALSHAGVPFTSFALFMGVAMAITAFPVLARILTDRKLDKTDLGVIALSCAASDDVTAWCLLALVVGVAQAQVGSALLVGVWAMLFIAAMFLVVRPAAVWLSRKCDDGPLPPLLLPGVTLALILSALATEAIGVHAVFGAFLLGAVIPHESRIAREFTKRTHDLTTVLMLPAFFAITGMNTRIGLIDGWRNWLMCGAIIVVATVGKFGGTLAAARFTGLDWRISASLGVLMNTRGLMELIVLNIGLGLGVISPTLFAMMVLMALATTMATAPALNWLLPKDAVNPQRAA
jgi:Kef-type K+ transport system membrane component KefB